MRQLPLRTFAPRELPLRELPLRELAALRLHSHAPAQGGAGIAQGRQPRRRSDRSDQAAEVFAFDRFRIGQRVILFAEQRTGINQHRVVIGSSEAGQRLSCAVRKHKLPAGVLRLSEAEYHYILRRCGIHFIKHIPAGQYRAAMNQNPIIGIQTAVYARWIRRGDDRAAVDDNPAVGINAVAFLTTAGIAPHRSAVDRDHGHTVLIGIQTVVSGMDDPASAVDCHVHGSLNAFVARFDRQRTGTCGFPAEIQRDLGFDRGVVFMQLFGCAFLIDSGNVST